MKLSNEEKKKLYCSGCYNDFYNGRSQGDCWSLSKSKVVMRKKVHVDQVPPWKQKPIKTLSCYYAQRYVMVGAKQEF